VKQNNKNNKNNKNNRIKAVTFMPAWQNVGVLKIYLKGILKRCVFRPFLKESTVCGVLSWFAGC